eukprot:913400-Pyramimonas_sp.AAC.1
MIGDRGDHLQLVRDEGLACKGQHVSRAGALRPRLQLLRDVGTPRLVPIKRHLLMFSHIGQSAREQTP